ncbi:MAG: Fic family protein [Bdellovibrionota bacterium]
MERVPVGYKAICDKLDLSTLPNYCESYIVKQGRGKIIIEGHREIRLYPKSYALNNENDTIAHLEFALKYEGINLEIITAFFKKIKFTEVIKYIQKQPTGIYARKMWYLYEFLTEQQLDIQDCQRIKYVDLLDPKIYFTGKIIKSSRHAINNNLLGNKNFCPFVRRTKVLETYIELNLSDKVNYLLKKYDAKFVSRVCSYLYTKETMSSYQIEKEQPDKARVSRFIAMLQKAPSIEYLSKEVLIQLQNMIVDIRFKDSDYRCTQNYVGESVQQQFEKIHYISPKFEDVSELMQGLLDSLERMFISQNAHPVIIAAAIAFGFVFIHPFEDGNGRIHRFLIHYILSKKEYTPNDILFPISSIMLQKMENYDAILESFSRPLLSVLTNYELSNEGKLAVNQESKAFYQYIDYTAISEYLFSCISDSIYSHIEKEIKFLLSYDKVKKCIQEIVDMPDKKIDLFIKFVTQNKGVLSNQKKERFFSMLTDDEIECLSKIINETMDMNEVLD